MEKHGHLIDGKWVQEGEGFSVLDKYTLEEFARVQEASRGNVTKAVDNALHTFHTIKLSSKERYNILMKAARIIEKQKEALAMLLVHEVGKSLKDAQVEIERGHQTLIASAEEAKRITGTGIPLALDQVEDKTAFTIRVPVGVIGAITPFNFPFLLTIHKIGPAIAAGNTVVLKPSELTPLISCKLADILLEAGLPPGFLNVVNGRGETTGEYLLEDERVSMYTFTGSPKVGRHIKSKTGIKKVTLELGNNSPNIIHKDAPDLKKAAELCVRRGFANAGQACISVQRVYVHKERYEDFIAIAKEVGNSLIVGDPKDPETDIGTMITEKEASRIDKWIQEAVKGGATCILGGKREKSQYYPTILTDVKPTMNVMCKEVFAPVINIISYEDIDDVFTQANDSPYGLQAGVFTQDLKVAMRAAHVLEYGGVIINDVSTYRADVMPYGGVKNSGIGKEGPYYAVQEMTEERIVVINY